MSSVDLFQQTGSTTWVGYPIPTEAISLSSLRAATGSHRDDSWGEREARQSLAEVEQGGRLYSFEEVFGEPL